MSARPDSDFNPEETPQCPTCERLLRLALAQPSRAEQEFIDWLDATLETPPEHVILFELLEQIRSAICFVREAVARHYLDAAPHFDSETEKHFRSGIEATHRMMRSYTFCAHLDEAGAPGNPADQTSQPGYLATVLHRCLHYSGMLIFEHYRAKLDLPAGVWTQHNTLFATAHRLGVATLQIDDHLFDETRPSHCQAVYVTPLLVERAAPYSRSPRELHLIWQWAEKAALKVAVHPLPASGPLPAYGIELDQDAPLRPLPMTKGRHGVHLLDTEHVTARLRRILDELARGVAPERLGLSAENLDQTRDILAQLAGLWSLQGAQRRRHPRHGKKGMVWVCTGFPAMHHFILDSDPNTAGRAQLKRLDQGDFAFHKEHWEIIDRSPGGLRLACEETASRLANHQLLALRSSDDAGYLLGQVAWLKREESGRLITGVDLLPGEPLAVSIRTLSSVKGEKSSFIRAFLLRQQPPGQSSLLLPTGLPAPFSVVEVFHDRLWELHLGDLLQHGADFLRFALRSA